MVSSSLVLSSSKGTWFPVPWSFPPVKVHGFQFLGPFLQERVMVSNSMVLSSRKGSWFPIPWSFPPGKGHGFQFHGPFLQERVMVSNSMVLSSRKGSWFPIPWSCPFLPTSSRLFFHPPLPSLPAHPSKCKTLRR